MSALGHKRTYAVQKGMSALPPKADMCSATRDVRFVPIADIAVKKKDRLVAVSPKSNPIFLIDPMRGRVETGHEKRAPLCDKLFSKRHKRYAPKTRLENAAITLSDPDQRLFGNPQFILPTRKISMR